MDRILSLLAMRNKGGAKWVELHSVTLEEEAVFDVTVDNSYSEYILAIVFPKVETAYNISTARGRFLGSYAMLYYRTLNVTTQYIKYVFHGRKLGNYALLGDIVRIGQNNQEIANDTPTTVIQELATTPYTLGDNGRMYIENALPAGTKIAIYAV